LDSNAVGLVVEKPNVNTVGIVLLNQKIDKILLQIKLSHLSL